MSHVHVTAKTVLFVQGEPVDHLAVITRGVVACWNALDDGRRQITGFLFPGDVIGHLFEERHSVTAHAITEVMLCRFPRQTLERLAREHHDIEDEFFKKTVEELSAAHQHELLLGRTSARERLAAFLVVLATADLDHGSPVEVPLPMTRFDIADYLGLTFETVSRTFASLAKENLIELPTPQLVRIGNLDALKALADGKNPG